METILIGIDEAGRGPLAGPVSVGVFAVRSKTILKKFKGVKDSKQLSEKQREEWFEKIKNVQAESIKDDVIQLAWAVGFSSSKIIDDKGIVYAIRSAMDKALKSVEKQMSVTFNCSSAKVLLDGSLKAPTRYINQKTIIDGDAKEPIISLASICAKVMRDRKMKRIAKLHANYDFDIHKGYGTKSHYLAIKKHGLSSEHRKSFLTRLTQ